MASGYDDDRYDPERDAREEHRGDRVEIARRRVATPGTLLLIAGLIGVLLQLLSIGLIAAKPTIIYDFFVQIVENQPPGPEKQKMLNDLKAQEKQMRLDTPVNIASSTLGLVLNILTVLGGTKMRSLSGYGISVTGAIAGLIPVGGCCCLTLPIGIWALVVLMNSDVKAGFAAAARQRETETDRGYDDRDRDRY
jgi:hypothetical protein